ncbi:MAG: hypothetical protein HQK58_18075, partial [Deltaproteobacteria bacterium]|nr:hypothetical protein [Deltaproteobacteria bacterium]
WRKTKLGPGTIPYSRVLIEKDANKLELIAQAMRSDEFITRYVNVDLVHQFVTRMVRGEDIGHLRANLVGRGILAGRFLQRVERDAD